MDIPHAYKTRLLMLYYALKLLLLYLYAYDMVLCQCAEILGHELAQGPKERVSSRDFSVAPEPYGVRTNKNSKTDSSVSAVEPKT